MPFIDMLLVDDKGEGEVIPYISCSQMGRYPLAVTTDQWLNHPAEVIDINGIENLIYWIENVQGLSQIDCTISVHHEEYGRGRPAIQPDWFLTVDRVDEDRPYDIRINKAAPWPEWFSHLVPDYIAKRISVYDEEANEYVPQEGSFRLGS